MHESPTSPQDGHEFDRTAGHSHEDGHAHEHSHDHHRREHREHGGYGGRAERTERAERGERGRGFGRGAGFGGREGRGERGGRDHSGHAGRGRRGDIRNAILIALQDGPAHGYELMQTLADKSGGRWRPSPGSVYPTLQMLEDAGLLSSEEVGGKRVFTLTEAGVTEAQTRKDAAGDVMPWQRPEDTDGSSILREAVVLFELAARQASLTRDEALVTKVTEVVNTARKSIYQLLAE